MFEHKSEQVLSTSGFVKRVGRHLFYAGFALVLVVGIGAVGFAWLENKMKWHDAVLNAAMLASGMGPVGCCDTISGKLFASAYALICGLLFMTATGVVMLPLIHRLLHTFHLESERTSASRTQRSWS